MKPEAALQSRARMFLDAHLPPGAIWTAIDKGVVYSGDAQQRMRTAQRLKAQGLKNGVEDCQIIYGQRIRAIELKVNSAQSEAQKVRERGLLANGHAYAICKSIEAIYEFLLADGVPLTPSARIAALHHDACLAGAGAVKKPRSSARHTAKPTRRQVARVEAMRSKVLF